MEKAILKAVEGGFNMYGYDTDHCHTTVLLEPLFWQALGKAMGWNEGGYEMSWSFCGDWISTTDGIDKSKMLWHRFIDHIAEGNDTESFFNELLK